MKEKTLEISNGYNWLTVFTNRFAQSNPELFYKVYKELFIEPKRLPNNFHTNVAWLNEKELVNTVVTMNLDNLLSDAGCNNVLDMWGNINTNYCTKCKKEFNLNYIQKHDIPHCDNCDSIVLPIFVNRNMVALKDGIEWASKPKNEVIVACGTKLNHTFNFSSELIIINDESTDYDSQARLIIRGDSEIIFNDIKNYFSNSI